VAAASTDDDELLLTPSLPSSLHVDGLRSMATEASSGEEEEAEEAEEDEADGRHKLTRKSASRI